MSESQYMLEVSERFPKEMDVPALSDIISELSKYGIDGAQQIRLIDSTHDAMDVRLNYMIDQKWVLRFCNAPDMTEKRMGDLNRLIGRYRAMGLQCPAFIADANGKYLHPWHQLQCYLSEYIDLPIAGDIELKDEDALTFQVGESVARFAETYRNVDLSETMGMYSLFDLSPFDLSNGMDEKQDNFNQLIALLRDEGENELADRLEARHGSIRGKLKAVYRELPRCVFQGDENFSNVLVDDAQQLAGLIDFNFAGTEVIVNQLANLAGFDYDEKHTEPEGAEARLKAALRYFQRHIGSMLRVYHASEQERQALVWYAWIVMVAQWPNLCYFRAAIKEGKLKREICELLSLIADLPEERMLAEEKPRLEIRKLTIHDGRDIYEMLQEMPADENGFVNSVNGKTYEAYQEWLKGAAQNAEQTGIIDGWKVPGTTFWLLEDDRPVGFGKVRHFLTDALREHGGNVGYAIRPSARGRGLGTEFLALLAAESKKLGVDQLLLTIQNYNTASIRVALANGGRIEKVTEDRHYLWIDL